jgi:hypothetical protein
MVDHGLPAQTAERRNLSRGGRDPFGKTSFSEKLVNGTMQRLSTPSHRRQRGEATLQTFVTPESELRRPRATVGKDAAPPTEALPFLPQRINYVMRISHCSISRNKESIGYFYWMTGCAFVSAEY